MFVNDTRLGFDGSKRRGLIKTLDFLIILFFKLGFHLKFDNKISIFLSQYT